MKWKELQELLINTDYYYFHTEHGVLLCGDSISVLPMIPPGSADLLITDPPYNISKEGNKIYRNYTHYHWKSQRDITLDYGEWDRQWNSREEFIEWMAEWFKFIPVILKDKSWLYIFIGKTDTFIFTELLFPKHGIKTKTIFVWIKTNPTPSFRKMTYLSATEFVVVGSKGESKIKNFLLQKEMVNYMMTPNKSIYGETEHPTEKPIQVIARFIRTSSNPGDVIIDPFMGSGTTAITAEMLERKWIGIEINEKYCEIIKNRLKQKDSQLSLF